MSDHHGCRCGDVDAVGGNNARESKYPMISVASALELVLNEVSQATNKHAFVSIEEARGYIAAQARHATEPFPPFPASTMDGYAVVSSDGVGTFKVVSEVTAGRGTNKTIQTQQVAYITTGAPVPAGADAVVPIEWTEGDPSNPEVVKITRAVSVGSNIRPVGSDITVGTTLLHAGQLIGPAEIGLLAGVGIKDVHVIEKPTVGVLSTGDEVVEHTREILNYGQIRDSNRPMLLALAGGAGSKVKDLGLVPDVELELEKRLVAAIEEVDIVVLSGGVSMGSLDLLKPLLTKLGTIHFGRLNMKPGKPTTFATVKAKNGITKLVFGLPGNPVSSFVTAQLLLVPAIKAWTGSAEDITGANHGYPILSVRLSSDLKKDSQRPEYHRLLVRFNGQTNEWVGESTGNQISSRLLSVCASNGLVIVPAGEGVIPKDTIVQTLLVGEWNLPRFIPQTITQDGSQGSSSSSAVPHLTSAHRPAPPIPAHMMPGSASIPPTASSTSSTTTIIPTVPVPPPFELRVAVLTVSDRCSSGESTDLSGPAIQALLKSANLKNTRILIHDTKCVPDEIPAIQGQIRLWCEADSTDAHPHLILTTGGTGFSPRDVTPEAVKALIERESSGFVHAMLTVSFFATPMGALSRPVAGSRGRTLILTLPGSPKAIPEILTPILPIVPHACKLLQDRIDPHTLPSPQPTTTATTSNASTAPTVAK